MYVLKFHQSRRHGRYHQYTTYNIGAWTTITSITTTAVEVIVPVLSPCTCFKINFSDRPEGLTACSTFSDRQRLWGYGLRRFRNRYIYLFTRQDKTTPVEVVDRCLPAGSMQQMQRQLSEDASSLSAQQQ